MAPNLDLFLNRPVIASPPLCSYAELQHVTLSQLIEMHEILDLKLAQAQRSEEKSQSFSRNKS